MASKAWFVRDGVFEGVDAALFTHVSSNLSVSWGAASGTGLVSVEFIYHGEAAHGAGAPWRGRSALDAVELLNTSWNFRREHMRPLQRSHYVITDGGDQPNVVPQRAAVWYYVREIDYEHIRENYDALLRMADAAAAMTGTTVEHRILGQAWPRHFNRPIAERMHRHIEAVGLPAWTADDQALARAVQRLVDGEENGLDTALDALQGPRDEPRSGGSDDIGDISWTVPTVTLRFPANIPGLPGHHWSSAIAMATPIAHKGVVAGAKVLARTALELFTDPTALRDARNYFQHVQTKDVTYTPFITADDPPPVWLNEDVLAAFRPRMRPFYYDETRYGTYLEQLGVRYPVLTPPAERERD